jgi:hypothetical protein
VWVRSNFVLKKIWSDVHLIKKENEEEIGKSEVRNFRQKFSICESQSIFLVGVRERAEAWDTAVISSAIFSREDPRGKPRRRGKIDLKLKSDVKWWLEQPLSLTPLFLPPHTLSLFSRDSGRILSTFRELHVADIARTSRPRTN